MVPGPRAPVSLAGVGLSGWGASLDEGIHRHIVGLLAPRGWRPRLIGLMGYGSERSLHVLGRVVLTRPADPGAGPASDPEAPGTPDTRGWRSYLTARVGNLPVRVRAGSQTVTTTSDRGGYIDVMVRDHGLGPGWHDVTIEGRAAAPVRARVLVVSESVELGIVSDVDDTIMVTMLPRPFVAAWNTFVRHRSARRAVPGMARLFRALRAAHPDAPVFYLSTGAWDVVPTLRAFMRDHGFPDGPLLMTDWAPTNTGWFRSGIEHKRTRLRDLMITFPNVRWVLIGDDGQHDPLIYDDVARVHPRKVAAIAIRTLTPAEQVLSHGTPETLQPLSRVRNAMAEHGVPTVRGRDGYDLITELPGLLPRP